MPRNTWPDTLSTKVIRFYLRIKTREKKHTFDKVRMHVKMQGKILWAIWGYLLTGSFDLANFHKKLVIICSCLPKYPINWSLLCSYYLANSLVCRLVPFLMDIGGQLISSRLFLKNDWLLWPIFWHCPACREPVMGLAPKCQVDYLGFCYTI